MTSRLPNRTVRLAGVMAIRRVLEIAEPGITLTIYVNNENLARCYDNRWINADGEMVADFDAANAIFELSKKLLIALSIEYRPLDKRAKELKNLATAAARKKTAALTAEERRLVPAAKNASDFTRTGGFPPVEVGDE